MAYSGGMGFAYHDDAKFAKEVFGFLKKALLNMDPEKPFRGPSFFKDGDFEYHSELMGDVLDLAGSELINYQGEEVFSQNFIGGIVVNK